MDTATVWSCILNSLYRGQILYGQPEANLNSQHSYIHISCSMMVQNKTKIRSQVICNSSASRFCPPSQCPSTQPIPTTLHAEAVYLKFDFLFDSFQVQESWPALMLTAAWYILPTTRLFISTQLLPFQASTPLDRDGTPPLTINCFPNCVIGKYAREVLRDAMACHMSASGS